MAKNKPNLRLGVINRGVSYKSAEVISKLSYVKPHLEYCIQFRSPINVNVKDADMLEGLQRRATKVIPSFKVGYVFFRA